MVGGWTAGWTSSRIPLLYCFLSLEMENRCLIKKLSIIITNLTELAGTNLEDCWIGQAHRDRDISLEAQHPGPSEEAL